MKVLFDAISSEFTLDPLNFHQLPGVLDQSIRYYEWVSVNQYSKWDEFYHQYLLVR